MQEQPVAPDVISKQVPQRRFKRAQVFLAIGLLLCSLSVGFLGGWLGAGSRAQQQTIGTEQARQTVANESELISSIAKTVGPSVVSITVTSEGRISNGFFSQAVQQESAGTGFFISEDGYIVTNRHVVPKGTQKVSIVLSDGTKINDVTVVGRTNDDDSLDIAFLKVTNAAGKKFTPVKLGDSSSMQVGAMVVAIGNALGEFQNTVTSGIISGYGRSVQASGGDQLENLQNLFQTDAAINQGNSGGPLVNANGEIIGVNTAVAGEGAENIGFAIPINDVKGLIKGVLEQGKLLRPYIGVRYVSLTDELAAQYNLSSKRGAYIVPAEGGAASILSGSPAEKAGLKEKDIITKVNSTTLNENNNLTSVVSQYAVGETVELTVWRDGQEIGVKVTLQAAPQS